MENKIASRALPLLDVTSLNAEDTDEKILALCEKVQASSLPVAAICIEARFLKLVKALNLPVKLATVVNFPHGTAKLNEVAKEIDVALIDGADEIDVVFPYHDFLAGKKNEVEKFMQEIKKLCAHATLKTILETGAYTNEKDIYAASELCIFTGANFLKTSTGKIAQGASIQAAKIMLEAIKKNNLSVGLKISGGIRTIEQVESYFNLTDEMMGKDWISPQTFRIGASSLFDELLIIK